MRGLIILVFVMGLFTVQASDLIVWSKGSVVEKGGQVRVGELSFQSVDLILFKTEGKMMVYTPYHVKAFFLL